MRHIDIFNITVEDLEAYFLHSTATAFSEASESCWLYIKRQNICLEGQVVITNEFQKFILDQHCAIVTLSRARMIHLIGFIFLAQNLIQH